MRTLSLKGQNFKNMQSFTSLALHDNKFENNKYEDFIAIFNFILNTVFKNIFKTLSGSNHQKKKVKNGQFRLSHIQNIRLSCKNSVL